MVYSLTRRIAGIRTIATTVSYLFKTSRQRVTATNTTNTTAAIGQITNTMLADRRDTTGRGEGRFGNAAIATDALIEDGEFVWVHIL